MRYAILLMTLAGWNSSVRAEEIALKEIWAFDMPDTRRVGELEKKHDFAGLSREEREKLSNVEVVRHALSHWNRPKGNKTAGPAFLVVGEGADALKQAAEVLKSGKEPPRSLPAGKDYTVVFYSYTAGRYIWVTDVNQDKNQVTIKYQAVPHTTANVTWHFALIPVGKLSQGVVRIKVEEAPATDSRGQQARPLANASQIVCRSFALELKE